MKEEQVDKNRLIGKKNVSKIIQEHSVLDK